MCRPAFAFRWSNTFHPSSYLTIMLKEKVTCVKIFLNKLCRTDGQAGLVTFGLECWGGVNGFVPAARGVVTRSGSVCGGQVSSAAPAPPGWTRAPVASPCHARQLQSLEKSAMSKHIQEDVNISNGRGILVSPQPWSFSIFTVAFHLSRDSHGFIIKLDPIFKYTWTCLCRNSFLVIILTITAAKTIFSGKKWENGNVWI